MDLRKSKSSHYFFSMRMHLLKIGIVGTLILSAIFFGSQVKLSHYFPIKTVRVYGVARADHQEVQDLLMPLVHHGFFTVNVEYIRDRLLQMPWVSHISVRRDWPDQIEVTVVEKNAIARWNNSSLLSDGGELFSPKENTYPVDLPVFAGPDGKQLVMLQYYKEINRILAILHAKISYLELTPYLAWKLTLDNGIILQIGHKDILTRLDHFVKVYPKMIGERAAEVEYVDLRYPNGMAVRWKEQAAA